jgi:uncharacterized membrane protein YfcA
MGLGRTSLAIQTSIDRGFDLSWRPGYLPCMPELFPTMMSFVLACLVMLAAQLIYATVGFGAGMFSIALLAMLLPDFTGSVAVLLLLTFVTEVWVLLHAWREARMRLLLGLLPAMAVGLWLGTETLVSGDPTDLKRGLGVFIAAAGAWFLYRERGTYAEPSNDGENAPTAGARRGAGISWCSVTGLTSGVLGGLFGTGGPPVIAFLKQHRLAKGAFRATLLWYFMVMSVIRAGAYVRAGVLTTDILHAGLWLLPASATGTVLGLVIHRRISERSFSMGVSMLLIALGLALLVGGGSPPG